MADFSFGQLLADPNFQNLLAGTGARLDPQGAGGAIGVPAREMIKSKAAQNATTKAESKRDAYNQQVLEAIRILGGISPKDQTGPTTMKQNSDGLTLDITLPQDTPASPEASGFGADPFGIRKQQNQGGASTNRKLSDVLFGLSPFS